MRCVFELFKRLGEDKRFLKFEWDEYKKVFNFLFIGFKIDFGISK